MSVQIAVAFQLDGGDLFAAFAGPLSARERTPATLPADAEAGIWTPVKNPDSTLCDGGLTPAADTRLCLFDDTGP